MNQARDGYVLIENVWKRFRRGEVHDSLRDLLPALSRRWARRPTRSGELSENEFWAVRDLSFEVQPGEALGIIGGNGAGKSTALKILTRILRPNHGTVEVRGRIGALIEISAGFHQDLTGRENIFLQGSIMGMPLALIRRRFDEIVEFSGIAEFLDTPVKRYSSGMQARLGFSIAVHLDPDVLIVDEVLAVGDFRFQDRAFAQIRELVTSGIPVVIVSHQLDRVASLCTTALVLERGAVVQRGSPADCIAWYLSGNQALDGQADHATGIHLHSLELEGAKDVASGERIRLRLRGMVANGGGAKEIVTVRIRSTATGQFVAAADSGRCGIDDLASGPFELGLELEMNLRPGVYSLESAVIDRVTSHDVAAGPIAYVQIQDDPGFFGTVQLKPKMWVESQPLSGRDGLRAKV